MTVHHFPQETVIKVFSVKRKWGRNSGVEIEASVMVGFQNKCLNYQGHCDDAHTVWVLGCHVPPQVGRVD